MLKKKKIHHAYVSKHNSTHEKQIHSFIYSKWGRMALSCTYDTIIISSIIIIIIFIMQMNSKYEGNFYYLNCLHSFKTKNKLE